VIRCFLSARCHGCTRRNGEVIQDDVLVTCSSRYERIGGRTEVMSGDTLSAPQAAQIYARMRASVGALLADVRGTFGIVLIDCPPGLSVLTESWLREADFHISPTKLDHISSYALEVLGHFKGLNPETRFAET
jgi:AAA domain